MIADDLTGALECGAKFAAHGAATRVCVQAEREDAAGVDVQVIDTESRHRSAEDAAAAVRAVAIRASPFAPWMIYKKTDSTLRGNIGPELRALLEVFPERRILFAPAYPQMGRMVRDGVLFVDGVPLDQTPFARDPMNPVRGSRIADVLEGLRVEIVDGETCADVDDAAARIANSAGSAIAAGPAALAGALAKLLYPSGPSTAPWPRLARCLVVNGSLHPASLGQVEFARSHGCFDERWNLCEFDAGGAGLERAGRTGERVASAVRESNVDALVVFGGDTAYGIHAALGGEPFEPLGEIVPGVPLSRCRGVHWITKAGGFGGRELLCDIRKRLE